MVRSFLRVPYKGRDFSDVKSKTQKYGYIPAKKQVENLLVAGKRLNAYNAGLYLYNAGSFDNFSSDDIASLSIPFYSSELDLVEKKAYLSGLSKARQERLARESDAQKRDLVQQRFDALLQAFERSISSEPAEDTSSQVTGVEGV